MLIPKSIACYLSPLGLVVTGAVMEADWLRRATRRRLGFESLVIVPLQAKRVDDVQAEGRRTLDGVANNFRFGSGFRPVARAKVVAAVEELGVDVVLVAVVNAPTVVFARWATFGNVLGFFLGFFFGNVLGFFMGFFFGKVLDFFLGFFVLTWVTFLFAALISWVDKCDVIWRGGGGRQIEFGHFRFGYNGCIF